MRYREGADPGSLGPPVDVSGITAATATYTLLIGIGLLLLGLRVRRYWVTFMGIGLVITSGGYLGAAALGLT